MSKHLGRPGLALVVLLATISWIRSASAEPFSDIFVFGDSFSDTGNIYAATSGLIPPDPPYFQGRFSNGPLWAERLAERLGLTLVPNGVDPQVVLGNNFAVAGALAAEDVPVGLLGTIPSVVSQVNFFATALGDVPSDALYVIFGGHADLRIAADPEENLTPMAQRQIVLEAVLAVETTVTRLASAGAMTFLVPNSVDLGRTPDARIIKQNAAEVTEITRSYNEALVPVLIDLENSLGVQIIQPDLYAFGEEIIDDALQNDGAMYGITNIDLPILEGVAGSPGTPPETSLFFDELHVSAVAHRILGDFVFSAVESAIGPDSGWQRPGDCNGDGELNISDPICFLGFLFLGSPGALPCGDGTASHEANIALMDYNGDGVLNLADSVGALNFLFGGTGAPHVLGGECVPIAGCGSVCDGED